MASLSDLVCPVIQSLSLAIFIRGSLVRESIVWDHDLALVEKHPLRH